MLDPKQFQLKLPPRFDPEDSVEEELEEIEEPTSARFKDSYERNGYENSAGNAFDGSLNDENSRAKIRTDRDVVDRFKPENDDKWDKDPARRRF